MLYIGRIFFFLNFSDSQSMLFPAIAGRLEGPLLKKTRCSYTIIYVHYPLMPLIDVSGYFS